MVQTISNSGKAKFLALAAIMLFVVLAPGMAKADNLVVNGSFDSTDGRYAGWTNQGFCCEGFQNWAHTGTYSAVSGCVEGCAAYADGAFVGQTINTVAGQTYTLSFWVSEDAGGASELAVYWNNLLVDYLQNPNPLTDPNALYSGWQLYTITGLLATGNQTYFQINGCQTLGEIAFDDVYVGTGGPNSPLTAVPEPASLMLLGSGLLGLGGVLRRRLA
jgi:hypothetical protein